MPQEMGAALEEMQSLAVGEPEFLDLSERRGWTRPSRAPTDMPPVGSASTLFGTPPAAASASAINASLVVARSSVANAEAAVSPPGQCNTPGI